MEQEQVIKKENVWTNIVDDDSSDEEQPKQEERESELCGTIKSDGKPCGAMRYKHHALCYNHLLKAGVRPKGRPKTVVPKVQLVAPEPIVMEREQPIKVQDPLIEKLTLKIKEKIDGLDSEMKLLLKMLL
jgi:hypothetical protein